MNTTTIWFENTTDKGNTAKVYVEVSDTPRSAAGKAHVSMGCVRRGDTDTMKQPMKGSYVSGRSDADAKAAEFIAQLEITPGLKRI